VPDRRDDLVRRFPNFTFVNKLVSIWNKIAFILLITALVFTTVGYGGVHQPIIAIFYILITLAGITWAADAYSTGNLKIRTEALQIPILGAAIYAFMQLIPFGSVAAVAGLESIPRTISLDPFATWSAALQLSALTVFFAVLLMCLNSVSRISKLCIFITIFGFAYAFFAILQSIQSPTRIFGIYDVPFGSPFGSFVNRNNFAAYIEMAMALPLGLVFAGAVIKDKKLLYITAIALMGVSLLLSDSRGGLVALFCEIIVLFFLTRKSTTRNGLALRVGLIVLLLAAIVGGSMFVGGDTALTRIAETAASEDFTTDRSHIWAVTVKVIAANMPFGAGFGAFGVAYPPFDTLSGLLRVEQAHNDYLQVLADAGIPGLILGGLFLFLFVRVGMRSVNIENTYRRGIALGAFAGCFGVLVHSFFDFVLHVTAVSLLFLTLLALLSACQLPYKDDVKNEPSRHKRKRRSSSSNLEGIEESELIR
jgi:O-antigen ligase